jgi:hypothetical protein
MLNDELRMRVQYLDHTKQHVKLLHEDLKVSNYHAGLVSA